MLDAEAASDLGWKTAAKRADAMENWSTARSSRPVPHLDSRPDRRAGSTSLNPFLLVTDQDFYELRVIIVSKRALFY
jgi:hypothetical protein